MTASAFTLVINKVLRQKINRNLKFEAYLLARVIKPISHGCNSREAFKYRVRDDFIVNFASLNQPVFNRRVLDLKFLKKLRWRSLTGDLTKWHSLVGNSRGRVFESLDDYHGFGSIKFKLGNIIINLYGI